MCVCVYVCVCACVCVCVHVCVCVCVCVCVSTEHEAHSTNCITVYTLCYAFPIGSPSRVTDSGDGNYRTFCFSGFRLEAIL